MNYEFEKNNHLVLRDVNKKKEVLVTVIVNAYSKQASEIIDTLYSINNQSFENIEILLLTEKEEKKVSEIIKKDQRIKVIKKTCNDLKDVFSLCSKNSQFYTILDAGETIHNTYIETSILTLRLREEQSITYTDAVNSETHKVWNYCFENHILGNIEIPVPNLFFSKTIIKELENLKIEELRTWDITIALIEKYKAIHQSYYGFETTKKESDLTSKNAIFFENKVFSCDIINYPQEDYFHEIISSHKNQLKIIPKSKTKKNILMMIPWMVVGGADKFNLDFLQLIDKKKYEVTILTDHPKEYVWRQKFEKNSESVFEMASFLDRKNWPTFLEYIIETRNIDLVFITNSMLGYNLIPYIRLKYPHLPVLDYIHSVELYNRHGGYGRDSSMLSSLIDKTIFCSKNAEKMGIELLHINPKKTKTVYIGVDHHFYAPDKELRNKAKEKYHVKDFFTVGYICRIDYPKRPLLLAEIINKTVQHNSKIKFIIGGDGPLLEDLKRKIKDYNLEENTIFLGNVQDTKEFYSMCDITLNCSIKEGLALTAYESLSMGVPVVSADVGGHKELIDSECGIIVPLYQSEDDINNYDYEEKEINAYVEAISKIQKNLSKYQKNGRKRIETTFSLENMIKNMEAEIESVINHPSMDAIENAKALKKNENMIYEYINNYLMGSQYAYQALIYSYQKYLGDLIDPSQFNVYGRILPKMKKYHLDQEYLLGKDFIKSLLKVILFPVRLLLIEIKKVKK